MTLTSLDLTRPVNDPAGTKGEVCPLAPWAAAEKLQRLACGLSKRDACDLLAREFPSRSRRWFVRNIERLTKLAPADFAAELYRDPTAREALRRLEGGGSYA